MAQVSEPRSAVTPMVWDGLADAAAPPGSGRPDLPPWSSVVGLPVLVLVVATLYLLATPEARLAYTERDEPF